MRLHRAIFFILLLCAAPFSSPRFALVLSGGGARGFAQIGVLKALESRNLKPDLIVATSMGSIIGALYAAGYSAETIAAMTEEVDWNRVFSNTPDRRNRFVSQKNGDAHELVEIRFDNDLQPILPTAISSGQSIYDLLVPLLILPQFKAKSNFDSLDIPLRIVATDLLSGNRVVFSHGNICTAIRASCAIPLAFTPVEMDSTLLIDGGVSSNIPIETARQNGADVVVAIDVTSPLWDKQELGNPVRLVDQIVSIGVGHQKKREKQHADLIITPQLNDIRNNDFTKIDSLVSCGFRSALPLCDSIIALLSEADDSSNVKKDLIEIDSTVNSALTSSSTAFSARTPVISDIVTLGNRQTSRRLLLHGSGIKPGDTVSVPNITKALSSLYATDLFENVNMDLDSSSRCRIMVNEKKYWRVRGGLRFDEFHLGEGYVEPAYENLLGRGITALMHLQYGLRREKYTFEINGNLLVSRLFANNVQFQLYSSKERILEVDTTIVDSVSMISTTSLHEHTLRKTGMNFFGGIQLGPYTLLSGGLRLERFNIQQKDSDMLHDLLGTTFKKTLPYFSINLTMDAMDTYHFPCNGTQQFISIGGANRAFGGRYTFIKCSGSIGQYFTIADIHTFFPRFNFGWSNNTLPEVERPYLGGAITEDRYQKLSIYNYIPFSGLPPRAVTGDCFGLCHFEYRCKIKKNIYMHLLFDWGTAWDYDNHGYKELITNAPAGIGIGLSIMTIAGPIRFSYGQLAKNSERYLSDKTEFFYFSAGYDF